MAGIHFSTTLQPSAVAETAAEYAAERLNAAANATAVLQQQQQQPAQGQQKPSSAGGLSFVVSSADDWCFRQSSIPAVPQAAPLPAGGVCFVAGNLCEWQPPQPVTLQQAPPQPPSLTLLRCAACAYRSLSMDHSWFLGAAWLPDCLRLSRHLCAKTLIRTVAYTSQHEGPVRGDCHYHRCRRARRPRLISTGREATSPASAVLAAAEAALLLQEAGTATGAVKPQIRRSRRARARAPPKHGDAAASGCGACSAAAGLARAASPGSELSSGSAMSSGSGAPLTSPFAALSQAPFGDD